MSLAILVGVLADDSPDPEAVESHRRNFCHVNRLLAANGLPPHVEPEALPDFRCRSQCPSFPYAWTPYLYRAIGRDARARNAHPLSNPTALIPVSCSTARIHRKNPNRVRHES